MADTVEMVGTFEDGDRVRLKAGSPELVVKSCKGNRVELTMENHGVGMWPSSTTFWLPAGHLELASRITGITSEEWLAIRRRCMGDEGRAAWRQYACAVAAIVPVLGNDRDDMTRIGKRADALLDLEISRFGEY